MFRNKVFETGVENYSFMVLNLTKARFCVFTYLLFAGGSLKEKNVIPS
jgi:hypothetical protein